MIQSQTPLNILMVTSEYPPELVGGLGTHVYELARELARLGSRVTVLSPSMFEREVTDGPNLTVHFFERGFESLEASPFHEMQWFVELNKKCVLYGRRLIKQKGLRPDVIHCHDWQGFPAAYQLGRLFGIPVVGTVHLMQNPTAYWWGDKVPQEIAKQERSLCRSADGVITVSHSMKQIIEETHQVPGERIEVVHNGMDNSPFLNAPLSREERDALRREHAAPDDKIIFFAGRLSTQKGIQALFESAARVLEQRPNARYLIAGSPDVWPEVWDGPRIADEAKKLFSSFFHRWDRVTFLGKVSRRDLPGLYQIADLALVPSVYEPFGYAAIEAMASGVPVVATAVGGLAEIIQHNETGLLVPVEPREGDTHLIDVAELCAAQIALLDDPELAGRLGREGQRRASERFGPEQMARATLGVYQTYARKTQEVPRADGTAARLQSAPVFAHAS